MGQTADAVLARNNVLVIGEGSQTIVFAHGFGTGQNAWNAQVDAFNDRYRCVVFDHVGSGKSDLNVFNPRRYSTLYSYASDLAEICRARGLRNILLVGHSVSGMVSLIASLLDRDLFDRMAIIGASPRYLNDPAAGYYGGFEQENIDSLFQARTANYYSWATSFAPMIMGNPERPHLAQYYADSLMALRPDISQAVLRVIFNSDCRAELPRVTDRVHVMLSGDNVAVPDCVGEYLAGQIPRAGLVRLETSGHLPHVSSPAVVNQVLAGWLAA